MKSSKIENTRFDPLIKIDQKIQKDQQEQSLLSSFSRRRRAGISPHSKIELANFTSFINGQG